MTPISRLKIRKINMLVLLLRGFLVGLVGLKLNLLLRLFSFAAYLSVNLVKLEDHGTK